MNKLSRGFKFFLLGLLLAAGPALADPGKVKRLEDALVTAIPMGEVFALIAGGDADWPRRQFDPGLSAGQSACLAGELSSEGERRRFRPLATRYVADNPARINDDLAMMELGGPVLGKMMIAGAKQEQTGVPVDQEAMLAALTPAQIEAFVALVADPKYAPLRELMGIGNAFNPEASQADNESAGEAAGEDLAVRIMRRAFAVCDTLFPMD